MKQKHPSYYLTHFQIALVAVLAAIYIYDNSAIVMRVLPSLLSATAIVVGLRLLSKLHQWVRVSEYMKNDSFIRGDSLPVRVYEPEVEPLL